MSCESMKQVSFAGVGLFIVFSLITAKGQPGPKLEYKGKISPQLGPGRALVVRLSSANTKSISEIPLHLDERDHVLTGKVGLPQWKEAKVALVIRTGGENVLF